MTKAKQEPIDFEKTLSQLEKLVDEMEKGGLNLEVALEKFERGIALTRDCQLSLKNAEQKVTILTEKNKQLSLEDFADDEE